MIIMFTLSNNFEISKKVTARTIVSFDGFVNDMFLVEIKKKDMNRLLSSKVSFIVKLFERFFFVIHKNFTVFPQYCANLAASSLHDKREAVEGK